MAARDVIHEPVKNALIKDGWQILADPFYVQYEDKSISADLRAEKLIHLAKDNNTIVVEIKSFLGHSFIKDLQKALGQYQMYAFFLQATNHTDRLYLAISQAVYEEKFDSKAVEQLLAFYRVELLVVDIDAEEIVSWKK